MFKSDFKLIGNRLLKASIRYAASKETASSETVSKMVLVQPDKEKKFLYCALKKLGLNDTHNEIMTDSLLFADSRGILTHGLSRFPMYANLVQDEKICKCSDPEIVSETPCSALVDGNNTFGAVVGTFCMKLAIKKAKECGFAWVSARGSNHFGVNSYFSLMAAVEKQIGIVATNTPLLMVPPNGKGNIFGTNPISVACGYDGLVFCLDNSMTKIARGKLEVSKNKGIKIPKDWALDKNGNPTDDPNKALEANLLLPAGEYKGYGLAGVMDLMSGVLSGAKHSSDLPGLGKPNKGPADIGHAFIAIDPSRFNDNFESRLQDFLKSVKQTPPLNDKMPVLIHGEIETHFQNVVSKKGHPFPETLLLIINDMANELRVEELEYTSAEDC